MASSAAVRQRKYRKRQAKGEAVYRVPAGYDVLDWLLDSCRLTAEQALDKVQVEIALAAILRELALDDRSHR